MPTVTRALSASPAAGRATFGTSGSRIPPWGLLSSAGSYGPPPEHVGACGPGWPRTERWVWRQAWSSPQMPGTGAPPRRVTPRLWKRFPAKPPLEAVLVPNVPGPQDNDMKQRHSSAQHPLGTWSPVTVKITPPECRLSPCASWRLQPPKESPDPCAKETALRAVHLGKKGKGGLTDHSGLRSPKPGHLPSSP